MDRPEGQEVRRLGRRTAWGSTGLKPAQCFFDSKNWSLGKENYIPGPFLLRFKRNVHRRDVGGIAKERLNHKATNAW